MKWYWILGSFIFCNSVAQLQAQDLLSFNDSNQIKERWRQAGNSIVLLRNDSSLLPLGNLDETNISWFSIGFQSDNTFEHTLSKYTTDRLRLGMKNRVVLLAVNSSVLEAESAERTRFGNLLKSSTKKGKIVVVIFGKAGLTLPMPELQSANAIIFSLGIDDVSQSLAAQIIFGGIGAKGKLQQESFGQFRKGEGIETNGGIRFAYTPPDIAGFSAALLYDSIDAIVNEGIRAHAFPGAQVLVAKDGQVVFHKTYGFHTYDSLQPVNSNDLYDFASVTKVTSTLPALMKFYGEGSFNLDAPLQKYFPLFRKTEKGAVTYREFLSHYGRLRPGIVFWRSAQDENRQWKPKSFKAEPSHRYSIRITDSLYLFRKYNKQIYKEIKDLPLNQNKEYVYSDLSFVLYPYVVERLSKKTLECYLKKTFYEQLGAFTLTYNPLQHFSKEQIVPTELDTFFRRIQVHGTVHDETAAMLDGISGHAGLFGSTNDLAKLFQMYLNGGVYGGQRFIEEAALKEFTRCQYCPQGNRRGLGFDKPLITYRPRDSYVAKSASPASFGHSGFTGTFVWVDPENNLLFIFMSNRVFPYRSSRGLYDLNIRERLHQAAYDAIIK